MDERFTGPLVIEEIGYELWRIDRPFEFVAGENRRVLVPSGFITDLASVPYLARGLVNKIGYWSQPAAVHDVLYRMHRTGQDTAWTRKQADQCLLMGMLVKEQQYKVPAHLHRADLIYASCRMGGLATWETPAEREARLTPLYGWEEA